MAFPFAATNLGLRSALEAIARRKNATLAQLSLSDSEYRHTGRDEGDCLGEHGCRY
jgi:hypothetical protein